MTTAVKVTSTVRLVELEKLDASELELEEGLYAGEWVLHLSPQVRLYLQTLGTNADLEAVEDLIALLRHVRDEILAARHQGDGHIRPRTLLPAGSDTATP
ncbi:hypothetical protein HNR23_000707 [Nocardiopsis mwathae]|uniref:Uncharacterized protein n=1 Tax=Nocardiopsis mwathae TaxID=1472723 RepID=A0A7W9YEJ0_9ACTN|nr:hypothetical protein [Nocardiopsis mwathae]MBB6170647.1 hypothetical protein [Nocardiopsis mwathae]